MIIQIPNAAQEELLVKKQYKYFNIAINLNKQNINIDYLKNDWTYLCLL